MKVCILGTSGMLGKYVEKHFESLNYEVISINRDIIDASSVSENYLKFIFTSLGLSKDDVIINCIGTIKPRIDALGDLNGILVNSVFPRIIANVCESMEINLIHPTTDCVYSGLKGSYDENDKYDVSDVYGMSKAMGEPSNCTVIRTSIIGEEVGQGRSLVEWIKSSANTTVNGFTNHFWNGITCLQFAKVCEQIIKTDNFWKGIKHLHSNTLNKQELVSVVSDVYRLNITVIPKETPSKCDRSMSSIHQENLDSFKIPTLKEQIIEMKEFSKILYS